MDSRNKFMVFTASVARCIRFESSDAAALGFLNRMYADRIDRANRNTQERKWLLDTLKHCDENGKVALIEGGMDCDCVAYEGHVHIVGSSVPEFEAALDEMYSWAEGSIHWEIKRPSEANQVKRTSRDLAAEAFENGHPWSIHY